MLGVCLVICVGGSVAYLLLSRKKFRLDSNDCGFIGGGVNFVGGNKGHALFYLSCL